MMKHEKCAAGPLVTPSEAVEVIDRHLSGTTCCWPQYVGRLWGMAAPEKEHDQKQDGLVSNCAGGWTPWGSCGGPLSPK